MSGLGTKLRVIFSGRDVQISTDDRPDHNLNDRSGGGSTVQSTERSNTRHSVIDTRAVIAIRWLALAGQTIALFIVAFGFGFAGAFQSAFGLVAVGAVINFWQSWRSRYQRVTSRPEL